MFEVVRTHRISTAGSTDQRNTSSTVTRVTTTRELGMGHPALTEEVQGGVVAAVRRGPERVGDRSGGGASSSHGGRVLPCGGRHPPAAGVPVADAAVVERA